MAFSSPLHLVLCGQSLIPKGCVNWTSVFIFSLGLSHFTLYFIYLACTVCQAFFEALWRHVLCMKVFIHLVFIIILHGSDYYYPSWGDGKAEAQAVSFPRAQELVSGKARIETQTVWFSSPAASWGMRDSIILWCPPACSPLLQVRSHISYTPRPSALSHTSPVCRQRARICPCLAMAPEASRGQEWGVRSTSLSCSSCFVQSPRSLSQPPWDCHEPQMRPAPSSTTRPFFGNWQGDASGKRA